MCTALNLATAIPTPHPVPHSQFPSSTLTSSTAAFSALSATSSQPRSSRDRTGKALTPQLVHPQLAQLPLQEPQLAQAHGDILVGEGVGDVGFGGWVLFGFDVWLGG